MSTLNVMSNDFLEGSTVTYQGNVEVSRLEVRHFRTTTPTGTFTIAGTVGSTPVAVNSTTSYASSSENYTLSTYTVLLADNLPTSQNLLLLQWPQLSPLPATTYVLGSGLAAAVVRPDGMTAASASAGSVELTSWTANHIAGSYSISITDGGTVDGAFDVDILIQN